MFRFKRDQLPTAETALKGRDDSMQISGKHYVLGTSMIPPFADSCEQLIIGLYPKNRIFFHHIKG